MKEQKSIKYPKTYRELIGRMLGWFWYPTIGVGTFVGGVIGIGLSILYPNEELLLLPGSIFIILTSVWIQRSHMGERFASKITFYEDRVVWRCFGFLPVVMKYDEMEYIGIETFDDFDRGIGAYGDEWTAYIYMSVNPYPEKYKRKILKLRTKKGFIKFKYTDGVAEALMDRLPSQKVEKVSGFYYHVKHIRAKEEQECAKEKLKRKRKREKRKREKEKKKAKRDL